MASGEKKKLTQPVTGVRLSNDETLARYGAECREERRDVRVPFCPWYLILHLMVQTCVHWRMPRLLRTAASDGKTACEP